MHHPGNNDILTEDALSAKRFLKPHQVESIERETQAIQWAMSGRSEYDGDDLTVVKGGNAPDRQYLDECLQRNQATLREGRPPNGLTQIQLAKYHKLERQLRDELTHAMPTQDQMMRPTESNVQWAIGWNTYYTGKAVAWQNVREILRFNLDPSNRDPFVTSIETQRTNTPPRGDPRRFRLNFDDMRFTDEVERALAQVDDDTFMRFASYKGLDWSDASIKKELGLTQAQFEACLDRLMDERARARGEPMEPAASNGHQEPPPVHVENNVQQRTADAYAMIGAERPSLPEDFTVQQLKDYLKARHIGPTAFAKLMQVPLWKSNAWLREGKQHRHMPEEYRRKLRQVLKVDEPTGARHDPDPVLHRDTKDDADAGSLLKGVEIEATRAIVASGILTKD